MASHFKWYPPSEETVVPWNARYTFPSQANKAVKTTPSIPPKNGANFFPGQTIRFEFPAQGYVNPNNTTFQFDVDLAGYNTTNTNFWVRFQNNIQSIFQRVRLLYGASPIEDLLQYNVVVRMLTEATTSNGGVNDQTSVSEGIGGTTFVYGSTSNNTNPSAYIPVSTRGRFIQGVECIDATTVYCVPNKVSSSYASSGTSSVSSRRRYQIQLCLGILQQGKLIPAKFMASQLAIEITLAPEVSCLIANSNPTGSSGSAAVSGTPTYAVSNLYMIPEILEFDASYGFYIF